MTENKGNKWDREEFTPNAGRPGDRERYRKNYTQIFEQADCSKCHVPLAPHEIVIDTGDGDELICDGCLHGTGSN